MRGIKAGTRVTLQFGIMFAIAFIAAGTYQRVYVQPEHDRIELKALNAQVAAVKADRNAHEAELSAHEGELEVWKTLRPLLETAASHERRISRLTDQLNELSARNERPIDSSTTQTTKATASSGAIDRFMSNQKNRDAVERAFLNMSSADVITPNKRIYQPLGGDAVLRQLLETTTPKID